MSEKKRTTLFKGMDLYVQASRLTLPILPTSSQMKNSCACKKEGMQ
jgi:hypothetical protein